jgi:RNA polymerase sigma-B factor
VTADGFPSPAPDDRTEVPALSHHSGPDVADGPTRPARQYAHLDAVLDRFLAEPAGGTRRVRLRAELAAGYAPLVHNIAGRYRNRGEPVEDLVQVGTIGLLNALDRYDPAAGTELIAFAIPTITGEIRRHFRDRTWAMRVPRRLKELQIPLARAQEELVRRLGRAPRVSELATALEVDREVVIEALHAADSYNTRSLDHALSEDGNSVGDLIGDPDPAIAMVDVHESLRPAIAALSERDRTILLMRFYGNHTQSEIAIRLGISQMHVSRLLAAMLVRLRGTLAEDTAHA